MKLRTTAPGLIGEDAERGRWVRLPGSEALVSFLAGANEAFPAPAAKVILGYERLTGRTSPKLKPLEIDGIGTLTNRISPTAVPV